MKISLTGIECYAYHGVLPQERTVGGWYALDIEVETDSRAAETDHLDDTINYAELYRIATEEMAVPSNLIEHAAGRIGRRIKAEHPKAHAIRIRLTKKNPPIEGANVSASVELCL